MSVLLRSDFIEVVSAFPELTKIVSAVSAKMQKEREDSMTSRSRRSGEPSFGGKVSGWASNRVRLLKFAKELDTKSLAVENAVHRMIGNYYA